MLFSTAFFAHAQQPATAAAFLVSRSDAKTVVISEPLQIDPKASNDQVVAQFGQTGGTGMDAAKWSVVRNVDLSTAQREKVKMAEKYKAKGFVVKPLK
ncbi:MAG: hypothetical protein IPK99_14165 [Flavobacteriales bacterium]|nr:hypothetical protein [Flavobacteriales bacterium]